MVPFDLIRTFADALVQFLHMRRPKRQMCVTIQDCKINTDIQRQGQPHISSLPQTSSSNHTTTSDLYTRKIKRKKNQQPSLQIPPSTSEHQVLDVEYKPQITATQGIAGQQVTIIRRKHMPFGDKLVAGEGSITINHKKATCHDIMGELKPHTATLGTLSSTFCFLLKCCVKTGQQRQAHDV